LVEVGLKAHDGNIHRRLLREVIRVASLYDAGNLDYEPILEEPLHGDPGLWHEKIIELISQASDRFDRWIRVEFQLEFDVSGFALTRLVLLSVDTGKTRRHQSRLDRT